MNKNLTRAARLIAELITLSEDSEVKSMITKELFEDEGGGQAVTDKELDDIVASFD